MNKYIRVIISTVFFSLGFIVELSAVNPFDKIRPIAEKGLDLIHWGDKEAALLMLQESYIRGLEWVAIDTVVNADTELFAQIVANIIVLRKELKNDDYNELVLQLLLRGGVEAVNREGNMFGAKPNIYPNLKMNKLIESTPNDSLIIDTATDLMSINKLRDAEYVLLYLYDKYWTQNPNNTNRFKFTVSNKLGLLYQRIGTIDKALDILRQNKLEMDRMEILDENYIETLVYMGFCCLAKEYNSLGRCYVEVAEFLTDQYRLDGTSILEDYKHVMKNLSTGSNQISTFIESNDRNFCFLTEKERLQRWSFISESWERLKSTLIAENTGEANINALLNAFQYEKQLMLRSETKIRSLLGESGVPDVINLLDSVQSIRTKMTNSFSPEWEELNAEYESLHKKLLHTDVLNIAPNHLYSSTGTYDIANNLFENETFIDFGTIEIDGIKTLFAILITRDKPMGQLVSLCDVETLNVFLAKTESDSTQEMVNNRYLDGFLYNTLWFPLCKTEMIKSTVFYCPDGPINHIMLDAINNDGTYIGEDIAFHILSSVENLKNVRESQRYKPAHIISFCGIDYICDRDELILEAQAHGSDRQLRENFFDRDDNRNTAFSIVSSISPLLDLNHYNWLYELGSKHSVNVELLSGVCASEYALKSLSHKPIDVLNISTHAFYNNESCESLKFPYLTNLSLNLNNTDMGTLLPMLRTGLFLSGAERSWCGRNIISRIEDGIVNAEELSLLDLSGVNLVTLIACGTGKGDLEDYEGIIGLRRALKMAGCKSMITTAWNVDKEAADVYLHIFYTSLMDGPGISSAHRKAQLELIKRFDSPYYWAVFQLVD